MTRGRLIARVADKIGLDITSSLPNEELTLLQEWANESVVDFLLKTRCYVTTGNITVTGGSKDTAIPSVALEILALESPSSVRLERVSLDEINDLHRVSTASGDIVKWALMPGTIRVFPKPTSNTNIPYIYVPRPTAMSSDSHDPSNTTYGGIMSEYHLGLEYYMLWQAAEYDDKSVPLNPRDYAQIYSDYCKDTRHRVRSRAGRTLPPMRAGYRRTYIPSRNDIYPG